MSTWTQSKKKLMSTYISCYLVCNCSLRFVLTCTNVTVSFSFFCSIWIAANPLPPTSTNDDPSTAGTTDTTNEDTTNDDTINEDTTNDAPSTAGTTDTTNDDTTNDDSSPAPNLSVRTINTAFALLLEDHIVTDHTPLVGCAAVMVTTALAVYKALGTNGDLKNIHDIVLSVKCILELTWSISSLNINQNQNNFDAVGINLFFERNTANI